MRASRDLVGWVAVISIVSAAPLRAADAVHPPAAATQKSDAEPLSERQASILLQLANTEANIKAINKALVLTGYKVGLAYEQKEGSEKANELMDRKGGGPVPWDQFYGKTAMSFKYHSASEVHLNAGRGAAVVDAQSQGSRLTNISRPKQFDYIYRANDQQSEHAQEQIASLLKNQTALLARRQKHETDQSALWAALAWEPVKDREIPFRPLYRFKLSPAGARTELLRGPILFLRTADKAIEEALDSVDADQAGAIADLRLRTKEAYANLQASMANAITAGDLKADDRKSAEGIKALCKQVMEECLVTDDNFRRAMESDRAKEDASKLEYRSALQSSMAKLAIIVGSLDEQIMTAADAWGLNPEMGTESPDKVSASLPHAPRVAIAPTPATEAPAMPKAGTKTPTAKPQPAWVALFNGRDLNGWVNRTGRDRATWTVQNGILVSGGGDGALVTARNDYVNVRIRVEAMINDRGNSGVYFRCQEGGEGVNFSRYEAQLESNGIDPNKTGSLYVFDMAQKKHSSVPVSVSESLVPPNRWCTIEILAEGPNITISVDGKQTVEYHDTRFMRGGIGLQQHIAGTVAKFRKIEVMELPE